MAEETRFREVRFGRDSQLVSPIDELRAEEYASAILSGAANYTSGQAIVTVAASNIVRLRPVRVTLFNNESGVRAVVLRDGVLSGSAILGGPWQLNGIQGQTIPYSELRGAYAVSGLALYVISGSFSAGINATIGYIVEADPTAPGGMIE